MSTSTQPAPFIAMRPLSLGDGFTATFAIYRRNFRQFLLLGALPALMALVLTLVPVVALAAPLIQVIGFGTGPLAQFENMPLLLVGVGVLALAGLLIAYFVQFLAIGLTAIATVQTNRGEPVTASSFWRQAKGLAGCCLGLLGVFWLVFVLPSVLFLALVVAVISFDWPGWLIFAAVAGEVTIYVITVARLGLVIQVAAIEGLGAIASIKQCWRLTFGAGARLFGSIMLAALLASLASQIAVSTTQMLSGSITNFLAEQVLSNDPWAILLIMTPVLVLSIAVNQLLAAVVMPLTNIFCTVLYIDQRRRREASAGQPLFV